MYKEVMSNDTITLLSSMGAFLCQLFIFQDLQLRL